MHLSDWEEEAGTAVITKRRGDEPRTPRFMICPQTPEAPALVAATLACTSASPTGMHKSAIFFEAAGTGLAAQPSLTHPVPAP